MGVSHLPELLIVLVLALILLGPKRLPDAGRSLGKAVRGFRTETQGLREEIAAIKDDTRGLKSEVLGMRDTVNSTVNDAIHPPPAKIAASAQVETSHSEDPAQQHDQAE